MSKHDKRLVLIFVSMMAILLGACQDNHPSTGEQSNAEAMPMAHGSDAMQAARLAFWQQDIQSAEKQYRSLVEGEDVNADAWGELGNVYYAQGKWSQAAEAYTEAALLLIKHKQMGQAMYLHQLVMRMDSKQAMRIDEKLRTEFATPAVQ